MPPGALTRTGLLTNPNRTPAEAAAQAEDPEACVSPAPRSQIKIEMVFGTERDGELYIDPFGENCVVLEFRADFQQILASPLFVSVLHRRHNEDCPR